MGSQSGKRPSHWFALLASVLVAFAICTVPAAPAAAADASAAATTTQSTYTEQVVPVYRESPESTETATLRMYGDVPYMNITDFYNNLYLTGAEDLGALPMTVTHSGDKYKATSYNETVATFDVAADTMVCSNLRTFIEMPYYTIKLKTDIDPYVPFVRVEQVKYTGVPQSSSIGFASYGIDLIGDGDELWMPLATLTHTFADCFGYTVRYNGEGLYFNDMYGRLQATNGAVDSGAFYEPFKAPGAARPEGRIASDYANLCYYIDTYFGRPLQCKNADLVASKGLDETLNELPGGPQVKAALHSADMKEYTSALYGLFDMVLYDSGHTYLQDTSWFAEGEDDSELIGEWRAKWLEAGVEYDDSAMRGMYETYTAYTTALSQAIDAGDFDKVIYYTETGEPPEDVVPYMYLEKGDTAMYVAGDIILCETDAWKEYIAGTRTEMPYDAFGGFMRALEQAKSNPNIKNFVVSLSANFGGETNVVVAMTEVMCGDSSLFYHDLLNQTTEEQVFAVDLNFDGTFNEADEAVTFPFNFAVVESRTSFSSANLFPSIVKDNDVPVIGERSSGGSCPIVVNAEPAGLMTVMSSSYSTWNRAGVTTDGGVEPDIVLPTTNEAGELDYAAFYDLDSLGDSIEQYYAAQAEATSVPQLATGSMDVGRRVSFVAVLVACFAGIGIAILLARSRR